MSKGKYKRRRLRQQMRQIPISDSGLSERVINSLLKSGLHTMEDLYFKTDEELKTISGVGKKALEEICALRSEIANSI